MTYFIKNFFIFLCCIYACKKLIKPHFSSYAKLSNLIFSALLTCISFPLKHHIAELTYVIPLILIWIHFTKITFNPKISFIATTIAFEISYIAFAVSSFISTVITIPIHHIAEEPLYLIIVILSVFLQLLLIIFIFRIKRFKKGMPFLFSEKLTNVATFLSLVLIFFLMYIEPKTPNLAFIMLFPLILVTMIAIFIHWWQAQITKSYKQALINRELESLRIELEAKEKQLSELSSKNEELGRLIHKDNKRIPAMEHAVSEFLIMDLSDKEKVIERANTLLIEIQKLASDRDHMITEIYARKYKHHSTGITEVDTMLNYMEKRAYENHIKLSVQVAINFEELVPSVISPEDLSHVLSDLLENAIIASKDNNTPIIQLQFYKSDKSFVIEIADNSIPFEAASLVSFGLTQLTTHADTGGSGIGLMDIWKIKEKYGASLHITEYNSDAPYTKKIALIFNKKNRYTISTERKEELLNLSKRTDLQIF